MVRTRDAVRLALVGIALTGTVCRRPAAAQPTVGASITVLPDNPNTILSTETSDQVQLDVFVNGRQLDLISPFILHADGTLSSARKELSEIGLRMPGELAGLTDIPLARLPGLTFIYDEPNQAIRFTALATALTPQIINGQLDSPEPDPIRPPLGAVLNYTFFASGDEAKGSGLAFDGVSGSFESRVFGRLGLLENAFVGRIGGDANDVVRLDSSYSYEDPHGLKTYQIGDFISGGFSWTRPIRMGGFQIRRSFGLRPDLVTVPLPSLTGSAAAPSTLELYVNSVRTLSTGVQQGPFAIEHPPIIYGGGTASIVLRDALGRETVSSTPFYASPDLLRRGLTDFSAEIGLARRNYASLSNDYDGVPAGSISWRSGITDRLTVQGHAETAGSLVLVGGGAVATMSNLALASFAIAGSRTSAGSGGLLDIAVESRNSRLSLLLRTQRLLGDYEDLASWTAVVPPLLGNDRSIFGQPREIDQASASAALPWKGAWVGASYIRSLREDQNSQLVNFSYTQDIGPLSLFASVTRDFQLRNSVGIFFGLSLPLGRGVTSSVGASHSAGQTSTYVEASQQGHHTPGSFGWTARATEGDQPEQEAIVRYGAQFARFEAGVQHTDTGVSGNALMEGALTLIGGGLHASQRVDDSFALVVVGVPGVPILRENRVAGLTDSRGQLIVPHLSPFVANRIALDPSNLPVDAEPSTTSATVAPFSRVPALVDLRVAKGDQSAVVTFLDPSGIPVELGSEVAGADDSEPFVVGYDGDTFMQRLREHNAVVITTPNRAVCRASFDYRPSKGNQVRIQAICRPQ